MGEHNLTLVDERKQAPDDIRFIYWAVFLSISPSYELARNVRNGVVTLEEAQTITSDIETTLKIYDDFGDLIDIPIEDWWKSNSYKLFGVDLAPEKIKILSVSQRGEPTDRAALLQKMNTYLEHTRTGMGNPLTMIVSIPLDISKKVILGTISEAVDHYRNERVDRTGTLAINAKYQMQYDRIQVRNLSKLLKLVWYKAKHPNLTLWEIGMNLNVNYKSAQDARISIEEGTQFLDAQNVLNATVSRWLKQARMISENAARGKFIRDDDCPFALSNFNWEFLQSKSKIIYPSILK